MFTLHFPLMDEIDDQDLAGGAESPEVEGESPSGDASDSDAPEGWLRDISEDDGYAILSSARNFPDHLRGLESRVFGRFGPIQQKLDEFGKALNSRVSFDAGKIKAALDKYDGSGALSEALVPALSEALQINQIDESTLSPFLSPFQETLAQQQAEQLVLSHYDPQDIAEMIPEVKDGRFAPTNQKQKDFVDWYGQQGYDTQQALLNFGAPYVRALRRFERWEQDKNKERERAVGAKSSRLAGGQQPSSQGRRPKVAGPQTAEEAFLAGFNEAD